MVLLPLQWVFSKECEHLLGDGPIPIFESSRCLDSRWGEGAQFMWLPIAYLSIIDRLVSLSGDKLGLNLLFWSLFNRFVEDPGKSAHVAVLSFCRLGCLLFDLLYRFRW